MHSEFDPDCPSNLWTALLLSLTTALQLVDGRWNRLLPPFVIGLIAFFILCQSLKENAQFVRRIIRTLHSRAWLVSANTACGESYSISLEDAGSEVSDSANRALSTDVSGMEELEEL